MISWNSQKRQNMNLNFRPSLIYFLLYLHCVSPSDHCFMTIHLCFMLPVNYTGLEVSISSFTVPAPYAPRHRKSHGCPLTWLECFSGWNCCLALQGPLQQQWSWEVHMLVSCGESTSLYSPFWELSDASPLPRSESSLLKGSPLFTSFQTVAALLRKIYLFFSFFHMTASFFKAV